MKHVDHFLRNNVEKKLVCMEFCDIMDQIADIFIKGLGRP